MLSLHLRLGLPSDLFPSGFPTNDLNAFLSPHSRYMPRPSHLPLYLAKSTTHAVPLYAVFPTLPSLHPSLVQIFSVPCSQTPAL
jgi:hypothetical protein